jgi:REP element-mobilizing transposase RayT
MLNMVLGYHLTLCTYGFWLPNDPRGSYSDYVGAKHLLPYGTATKVETRRSLARKPHNFTVRRLAKEALKYAPVELTGIQAREVGRAFGKYLRDSDITVWACCILPHHAHLAVARCHLEIEEVANQLKGAATRQLIATNMHPLSAWTTVRGRPPCMWSRKEWKVFLDSEDDIRRTIRYVNDNPVREGKRPQTWGFVTPYTNAV